MSPELYEVIWLHWTKNRRESTVDCSRNFSSPIASKELVEMGKWEIDGLTKFILFIGPISSIFDYLTFFIMLYVFNSWNNPALFHTGWCVESLFTQTLIIHVIRTNKIPFIQSHASRPLLLMSLLIVLIGAVLPLSPLAESLGFVPLPLGFWPLIGIMLVAYIGLTQIVKTWFIHHYES